MPRYRPRALFCFRKVSYTTAAPVQPWRHTLELKGTSTAHCEELAIFYATLLCTQKSCEKNKNILRFIRTWRKKIDWVCKNLIDPPFKNFSTWWPTVQCYQLHWTGISVGPVGCAMFELGLEPQLSWWVTGYHWPGWRYSDPGSPNTCRSVHGFLPLLLQSSHITPTRDSTGWMNQTWYT